MEDSKIIDLYWARKEQALAETDAKYGSYCRTIARNILRNFEDTEECVSDTWLHAWNSMPPQRPGILSAFLGRITRNLSFDRCKYQQAAKRGVKTVYGVVTSPNPPSEALHQAMGFHVAARFRWTSSASASRPPGAWSTRWSKRSWPQQSTAFCGRCRRRTVISFCGGTGMSTPSRSLQTGMV